MASDWEKIERIYQNALQLEPEQRAPFIQAATGGDEELCREIESLLSYQLKAEKFLDVSALHSAAKGLARGQLRSLVGQQIAAYKVVSLLGAGGMGEVYRAVDSRLNRTVAIKRLPSHLSLRPDLRKRFEREARTISNLNHPHICTLYDIGQQDGFDFLVMEYLDGQTLAERLKTGSLSLAQVLQYSAHISDALAQAHRQGVVHRDLKPGNIMLTARGAKLLDFGLAKLEAEPQAPGLTSTVALAAEGKSLTAEGIILGTLEYMAPEQLEGREVDARTDIFSLGTVIYEMATGRKAFTGGSKASVIVAILTTQPPPVTSFQPLTPPELEHVVQKCLRKEPAERWQSAGEVTRQLKEISQTPLASTLSQTATRALVADRLAIGSQILPTDPTPVRKPRKFLSPLIHSAAWKLSMAGFLAVLTIASLMTWRVRQRREIPSKEMSIKPLTSYSSEAPVKGAGISPDGKYLAFCSEGKLLIQIVATGERRFLALPEGFQPFTVSWFPDGTKLLLVRAERQRSDGSVWALPLLGGTPQRIVDQASFPSVSPDGSLVAFSRSNAERNAVETWVVGANGEGPRRVRVPSFGEGPLTIPPGYYGPVWSSDGQRLFYLRDDEKSRFIESCDLRGEKVTTVFSSKVVGFHSLCSAPDGRILFSMHSDSQAGLPVTANLWEIKVDAATGKPLSEARRLTQWSGFSNVNVYSLSITSDGQKVVLLRGSAQTDVYVAELGLGGKSMKTPKRLTLVESDDAVWDWTADSRAVLFASTRNGREDFDIFKQDIGQANAETIVATPENEWHPNFSPDGSFVLYLVSNKRGALATRLMRVPVSGGPPELVLGGKIKNFSCAREANLCVVAEDVDGEPALNTFDPLKGRGDKLPISDYRTRAASFMPDFGSSILSPQGRLIDRMKSGPEGLHIRVRSLRGGPVENITFKNLTGDYQFYGWSLDGKGMYVGRGWSYWDFLPVLYAGQDGHSQILWQQGSSPGWWFDYPIPSPNGRYLAVTIGIWESNAWVLENF